MTRVIATKASLLLTALTLSLVAWQATAGSRVTVFAAASLTDAINALVARYEDDHPVDVVPVFAASSTLARQIANGAPADLFLSANNRWMDWLATQSVTLHDHQPLLGNRLALIAPTSSHLQPFTPGSGGFIRERLEPGDRLAVGDPDHVPAGLYTRQALETLGEWETLRRRLARTDDVRGALALVARGETPLGIVYATDARASEAVQRIGLLPADSHTTIRYPIALIGDHPGPAARRFRTWLQSPPSHALFRSFGFTTSRPEAVRDAD